MMRLTLLAPTQGDLFLSSQLPTQGRMEWLSQLFFQGIEFEHRNSLLHYVPVGHVEHEKKSLIAGRIGKQVTVHEHEPPEDGLTETERLSWQASIVLIDPSQHEDGQKILMEMHPAVGKPFAVLSSLIKSINESKAGRPYLLHIEPITEEKTFWEFVQANKDQVTHLNFEFLAPNMFFDDGTFDSEMRSMKEKEKAQKARFGIESIDGLNLETDRVRTAVNRALRGTGAVRAKTRSGKKFNSRERVKTKTIDARELDRTDVKSLISSAVRLIFNS
jgi:hypothetical protein